MKALLLGATIGLALGILLGRWIGDDTDRAEFANDV